MNTLKYGDLKTNLKEERKMWRRNSRKKTIVHENILSLTLFSIFLCFKSWIHIIIIIIIIIWKLFPTDKTKHRHTQKKNPENNLFLFVCLFCFLELIDCLLESHCNISILSFSLSLFLSFCLCVCVATLFLSPSRKPQQQQPGETTTTTTSTTTTITNQNKNTRKEIWR